MPQPLRPKPKLGKGPDDSREPSGLLASFGATNQMSHSGPKGLQTGITQCFVCERSIVGDHWFAQVKHGNWTIWLCCLQCSKLFYTQRLPGLRRVAFLAALRSLAWPTQSDVCFNRS